MTDNKEMQIAIETEKPTKTEAEKDVKAEMPKKAKAKKEEKAEKAKKTKAKKEEKAEKSKKAKAKKEDKSEKETKAKKSKKSETPKSEEKESKDKVADKAEKKTKKKSTAKKKKKSSGIGNIKYLGGLLFKKMAFGGAEELSSNADEVNRLNVFPVPDGDTGDNMHMTIESGITEMEGVNSDNIGKVIQSLSHGMLLGARGNSGVILSQFFAGTAKGLESVSKADPETLGRALELGVKQAYSSVMTPTEGTILTVAREAVEYAVSRITPKSTIRSLFADLSAEMNRSVERTPEILTVLKEAGVVDSGAAGLFHIIDGFNRVLNGKGNTKDYHHETKKKESEVPVKNYFGPDSVMTFGYCTEFLLQLQTAKGNIDEFDVDALKEFLVSVGDSIVAFKTDSIVKVHVHTLVPEKVLEYARRYGEFLSVKIENMSLQHSETLEAVPEKEAEEEKAPAEKKKYGVVTVCNGEGIENLFHDLGADVTVTGGQTHNPSTQDFIEAFEKVNAENIFVFPNNGNIFMAAQQAAELYESAKVHVISSKNLGTGYVALSSINFENPDVDSVIADMEAAMSRVACGSISPAIRDADMNGVHVNNGDTIGIVGKEIVLADPERKVAACKLATMLLDMPDKFMITAFCGVDSNEEERREIEEYITKNHSSAEVYFIDGGQEIYPYIFTAE